MSDKNLMRKIDYSIYFKYINYYITYIQVTLVAFCIKCYKKDFPYFCGKDKMIIRDLLDCVIYRIPNRKLLL